MKVLVGIPYYTCDNPGGRDCILGGWNQPNFFGMSFVDKNNVSSALVVSKCVQ